MCMVITIISVYLLAFLSAYLFLLFLASTLAGCGSLSSEVKQTFISEEFGPLTVLSAGLHQFILL